MPTSKDAICRKYGISPDEAGVLAALALRPSCENCNRPLPPDAVDARICSFECTFCAACVEHVLRNVCPNCGGGFERRPIRPARNWRHDNYLGAYPACTRVTHKPVNAAVHAVFSSALERLPPARR